MGVAKVEVERFSVTSSRPFAEVVAKLRAGVGHPNMSGFGNWVKDARTFADYEAHVKKGLGPTGLMQFMEFDHGAILRAESGNPAPNVMRFLIGNPLIMKEMARHVADAGSYAPVTILVDERVDGVHLSYDRMASFLSAYGNSEALAVARSLDAKIENLLRESAS